MSIETNKNNVKRTVFSVVAHYRGAKQKPKCDYVTCNSGRHWHCLPGQ